MSWTIAARTIGAVLLGLCTLQAPAQPTDAWPQRPIRLVVPGGSGSGSDLVARAMARELGKALQQPVIVEDKPGANGIIANEIVAKAAADGHTLLLGNASSISVNAARASVRHASGSSGPSTISNGS